MEKATIIIDMSAVVTVNKTTEYILDSAGCVAGNKGSTANSTACIPHPILKPRMGNAAGIPIATLPADFGVLAPSQRRTAPAQHRANPDRTDPYPTPPRVGGQAIHRGRDNSSTPRAKCRPAWRADARKRTRRDRCSGDGASLEEMAVAVSFEELSVVSEKAPNAFGRCLVLLARRGEASCSFAVPNGTASKSPSERSKPLDSVFTSFMAPARLSPRAVGKSSFGTEAAPPGSSEGKDDVDMPFSTSAARSLSNGCSPSLYGLDPPYSGGI
mmetsp:Transcript_9283/g.28003  ORF Transcript_9283/g.28003 Transcript_9283/m.28003 type:complete len:271 (-) Transcript_9283:1458-2270(-)